nr:transposon Ty3-I Gag-Pol polyprotein [Tanacetum cinerariifolium]
MNAEVVKDHTEKIQDLQSYKQHDDNISTLSFGTTSKVGFRVDVKRKSIEDKVRREMFDVDKALVIENSRASSFQLRWIHVETKVNVVRDWPSPKTLPEIKEVPTLKVTEICKVSLAIGKHYKELVNCDVVDMKAYHVTLVASPKEFQSERKEMGVSYTLVVKGVKYVIENAIPTVIKPILAEFGKIVTDDAPDALTPWRNIQHQIDLSRKTTLFVSVSNEVLGLNSIKELSHLIKEVHAGGLSAHLGRYKTIVSVERRFYSPQLKRDVGAFMKRCVVCQEGKDKAQNTSFYIPLPVPESPWVDISIDCVLGHPRTQQGYTVHPQIDGQTKVVNRTLRSMISCLCGEKPKLYDVSLAQAEIAYNSAIHSSTVFLPFEVVYKTSPRYVVDLSRKHNVQANRMVKQVQVSHEVVRANITEANAKYKITADKHRRKKLFQPGDEVMVFLHKERFSVETYSKLQPKKYGSYKILLKINDNAYVVDLPNTMSISKTFNLSDIYEFHSKDVNKEKHSRMSSFKERENDEDMINMLAEEYIDQIDRGKRKNEIISGRSNVTPNK